MEFYSNLPAFITKILRAVNLPFQLEASCSLKYICLTFLCIFQVVFVVHLFVF